ncbi:MAG: class I SAM-dependent methyltransferase [Rhizobacter sp.]
METRQHWEAVYGAKTPDAVSWYAPHLTESLFYIQRTGLPNSAAVIDVGGGEATLVDDLLDAGYGDVTVLDISAKALKVARQRLGDRADQVEWLVADVLTHDLAPQSVDIWHDRAVFHFLTGEDQRRRYVQQVLQALRPGGYAIVGAFGPEGPTQCSGLPVARYGAAELHGQFGHRFRLVDSRIDVHTTPWGAAQQFVYCFCKLMA